MSLLEHHNDQVIVDSGSLARFLEDAFAEPEGVAGWFRQGYLCLVGVDPFSQIPDLTLVFRNRWPE